MYFARTSLCLLLFAVSQLTAADPAPVKEKEKEKEPVERIVATGKVIGTVNNWNESEGKFTVHIKSRYVEANQQAQQDYARELQDLANRQQNILRNPNPMQRQQEMIKLIQDTQAMQAKQRNFYQVKESEQDVNVELAVDADVRSSSPPALFDEKGNIKAYTPEELKELRKGSEHLPGFPAERDSLRNGQTVQVTIGYKIGGKAPVPEAQADEKKPEDGDKKKMPPAPKRPKVITVLILAEPKN